MTKECQPRIKEFDNRKMARKLGPGRKIVVTFWLSKRANVEWCDIVQTLWPCDKNVTQGSLVTISWGALWHCCGTVWPRVALCIIVRSETVCGLWHCAALSYIVSLSETAGVKGAQAHVTRASTQSQCGENFSLGFLLLLITLHCIGLLHITQNRRRNYVWETILYI